MSAVFYVAVDVATVGLTADDRLLAEALVAAGGEVIPVIWGEPIPRRSTVVLRSTWDYVEDPHRFLVWLARLDADSVIVHNPTSLLRWNLHKSYLVDLAERGVPVVPTVVLSRHHDVELGELLRVRGWDDAVVKPAVGGTARLAVHVGRIGLDDAQRHVDGLLANEDVVVQQFVTSVPAEGETSVIAIGGVVTHAVRKRASEGDWRVQTEFGGTVEPIAVDDELSAAAQTALSACQPTPLYARIDLVTAVDGGLQVIELELVEPELFFRWSPPAARRMAHILTHPHSTDTRDAT